MLIRLSKLAMVAAVAALFTVVAFGNITDYGTNYAFVQHVMSMDTLFPTTTITYRAITDPALHRAAYALIIATECATAALCCVGALILLLRCRGPAPNFDRGKTVAIAGLTLGVLLYLFGFMVIGGEWFGMWMSQQWNGVSSAFRFLTTVLLVLLFVVLPDGEIEAPRAPPSG
jgi:predicted small integral membrane protein